LYPYCPPSFFNLAELDSSLNNYITMEVAGIEPASLKRQQETPTCLALYFIFSLKTPKGGIL